MQKTEPVFFRWLGVAGFELKIGGSILLVDPYFTRVPFYRMWVGKVIPDKELIRKYVKNCDFILVTHSHIDHLMDVGEIVGNNSCRVYGSNNTCKILSFSGIDDKYIFKIKAGDTIDLDGIKVMVLHANHRNVLGFGSGNINGNLKPPFSARQYRMDICFAFKISVGDIDFLTDPGINNIPDNFRSSDVLFVSASYSEKYYRLLFKNIKPEILIPIHWDNFFYPLSVPLKPYFKAPSIKFPFIKKVDLDEFVRDIENIDPEIKVLVPDIFKVYDIAKTINH